MIHMFSMLKGGLTLTGLVAGGACGSVMLAENINDATTIQLGLAGGLGVGIFYAGAALQKLKDGQKATNKRLSRIERKLNISEDDDENETSE